MDINELFNQFTLFDPAKGQRANLPAVEGNYIVVLKAGCNIPDVLGNFKYTEVSLHCLLYTSPSPRDATLSRMPSSA